MHQTSRPRLEAESPLQIKPFWECPALPPTGGEATLLLQFAAPKAADSTRRAPVDVALVLDHSGSMAGEKLALAKQAVDLAVAQLSDHDRAALVVYDHTVSILHALEPMTPRVKAALRLALHGVDAGGSTNLSDGWLTGCQQLATAPAATVPAGDQTPLRLQRTLLMTDGLANDGMTDAGELTTHAHELRKRGIHTTTLGVGLDFDEVLLSGLAEAGGGNFQFIAEPVQLRAFFARELQEMLTIAAAGVTLTVTLPAGIEIEVVNSFPSERRQQQITIALGDLPAGDEIDLVLLVRVPAGAIGTTHQIAVSASWADPTADSRRHCDLLLPPLVLQNPAQIATIVPEPLVTERAALQRATAERRTALALDRAGRHAESRASMRRAYVRLQAAPRTADVAHDLDLSAAYASASEAPYSEADRKAAAFHNARRGRGKRDSLGEEPSRDRRFLSSAPDPSHQVDRD